MRRLLRGVAFLAILAPGCAAVRIEPEVPVRPAGPLASQKGRPGLVIGAPHGRSDAGTDRISVELARRTGFGLVVATYADLDSGRRLNVNRPTEGVRGASPSDVSRAKPGWRPDKCTSTGPIMQGWCPRLSDSVV